MTLEAYAKNIIETVENSSSKEEAMSFIKNLLNQLEPRDREAFSKWGYPDQQSTKEDCWPDYGIVFTSKKNK